MLEQRTVNRSLVKPGQWFACQDFGWSLKRRRTCQIIALLAVVSVAVVVLAGMNVYSVAICALLSRVWISLLHERPKPLDRELPANHHEISAQIEVFQNREHLGDDLGLIWFEGGRMFFTGQACSFVLSRDDILWDTPKEALPYVKEKVLVMLKADAMHLEIQVGDIAILQTFISAMQRTPDDSIECRQLPPTGLQEIPKSTLRWFDPRMWIPLLPVRAQDSPTGGFVWPAVSFLACCFWLFQCTSDFGSLLGMVVALGYDPCWDKKLRKLFRV